MFNRKKNNWYQVAMKLHRKERLEEPYDSLFYYYINLTYDTPFRSVAYLSHFSYLFHFKLEDSLDSLAENLNSILPENFKRNFNSALGKFNKITDYDFFDNDELFEAEDDFVEENSQVLKDILENYIDTLARY
ncbi:MAG: hypothetical protein K2M64_00485 [Clostridia bacterium]|nr:hypothetical protein [Clostridia bacterium]